MRISDNNGVGLRFYRRIALYTLLLSAPTSNAAAVTWEVTGQLEADQASIFHGSVTVISPNTAPGLWVSTSAATPHLYVSNTGLVGAGTVGTGARLDVKATGSADTDYAQIWRNASGTIVSSMSATGALYPAQTCDYTPDYPAGAVLFFDLSSCPPGWSELTVARGRYLVGKPSGGTLAGTAGTPLSDLENRPVGQHNHGKTDPGHTHTSAQFSDNNNYGSGFSYFYPCVNGNTNSATTGITVNNTGTTAGTNAPYMQLLICEKD